MTFEVRNLQDSIYQVIEKVESSNMYLRELYPEDYSDEVCFQGTLADCEAFIRLIEQGYMQ